MKSYTGRQRELSPEGRLAFALSGVAMVISGGVIGYVLIEGWTFLEGSMFAWLTAPAFGWLALKICLFIFVFFWLRATFPRYRYDQIMRLGWKIFIPITIIWIAVEGVMAYLQVGPWSNLTG